MGLVVVFIRADLLRIVIIEIGPVGNDHFKGVTGDSLCKVGMEHGGPYRCLLEDFCFFVEVLYDMPIVSRIELAVLQYLFRRYSFFAVPVKVEGAVDLRYDLTNGKNIIVEEQYCVVCGIIDITDIPSPDDSRSTVSNECLVMHAFAQTVHIEEQCHVTQ